MIFLIKPGPNTQWERQQTLNQQHNSSCSQGAQICLPVNPLPHRDAF